MTVVATDCSDIASAAERIAAVLELVETPAGSGNSAQVVAVLEPVTRTDSSYQLVVQRSPIEVETQSVEEEPWLISVVARPAPPMGPMSSSLVAVSSRPRYH